MNIYKFQVVGDKSVDRADHVWHEVHCDDGTSHFKCVLCGAISASPPDYPTPARWLPGRYEQLTPTERAMCPYVGG